MGRLSTDTAVAIAQAARERDEQHTPKSKIKDTPSVPGKRDRLAGKQFAPDIATELTHTEGQRLRPSTGHDPPEGGAGLWSVTSWCRFVGISRTAYYAAKKLGNTPDELHIGNRRLITPESHARWVKRQTVRARPQQAAMPAA